MQFPEIQTHVFKNNHKIHTKTKQFPEIQMQFPEIQTQTNTQTQTQTKFKNHMCCGFSKTTKQKTQQPTNNNQQTTQTTQTHNKQHTTQTCGIFRMLWFVFICISANLLLRFL